MSDKITYSVTEFAAATGLSKTSIYKLLGKGTLPSIVFGGNRLISYEEGRQAFFNMVLNATSHVYVIGPSAGPYKIGTSTNTKKRLSKLQVSTHEKLELFFSVEVEGRAARAAERAAHTS